jgi:hypothetical protein
MGKIYRVQDTDIKKKVVFKLFRPEITRGEGNYEMSILWDRES